MQRLIWAIKCFFLVLFTGRLPAGAVEAYAPRELLAAGKTASLPPASPPAKPRDLRADGAVQALAVLQREGRLFDFLLEDIAGYADDQVGAAVRAIHKGCRKALDDHFPLAPILDGREEETVRVPVGFDPAAIRLLGNVTGEPPFSGVLRHHGWKTLKVELPNLPDGASVASVVAPAEVELA